MSAAGAGRTAGLFGRVAVDLVLAAGLALGTIVAASLAWQRLVPDASRLDAVVFALVASGAGLGIAAAVTLLRRPPSRRDVQAALGAAARAGFWGAVAATACTTFLLTHVVLLGANALGLDATPGNNPLLNALVSEHTLLLALFVIVVAPVVEETLFRRVVFGRLWAAGWPRTGAALSALAFAVAHEPWRPELAQWLLLLAVYAGMGVLLCMLYRRTRSLLAPIAAHGLHNALTLLLALVALPG